MILIPKPHHKRHRVIGAITVFAIAAVVSGILWPSKPNPSASTIVGSYTASPTISNLITKTVPDINSRPAAIAPDVPIYSQAYILLDRKTKYPLVEKNADTPLPIASTTKIMTAIVTLESEPLDKVVATPSWIGDIEPTVIGLYPGEKMTVQNLLYGMLLNSGNDAANTLATASGSVADFVAKMNKKASDLGLTNTQYKDPAGLNDDGHSSAHDLAILTDYALNNPIFAKIVDTPKYTIASANNYNTYDLINANRLIQPDEPLYYPNAIGVKTGLTDKAGHCLVAAAKWGDKSVIAVVLNTNSDSVDASAAEARKLLTLAAPQN